MTEGLAANAAFAAPVPAPARAAPKPVEGLGGGSAPTLDSDNSGGSDLTLNPDNDTERSSLDPEAATTTTAGERNPRVDGRPIDPLHRDDGWGSQYGACHGIPAFKNIVEDEGERQRIADLHDDASPGLDLFGLTVPFQGAMAYQCVEFVTRYYRDALGYTGIGGGNAETFLQGTRGGLEVHRFPTPTRPQAGDLMVQEGGPSPVGHVAIVERVDGNKVTIVDQNRSTTSPRTDFDITQVQGEDVVNGVTQQVTLYQGSEHWAGFRRKPGTTPVAERGGTTDSRWLSEQPNHHGAGDYMVPPEERIALDTVKRIYGLETDDLRRFNPGIPNEVVGPFQIRVTDSFEPPAPVRGTATIDQRARIRTGPGPSSPRVPDTGQLPPGLVVTIHEVVPGEQVAGVSEWYRIAIYSGADAYIWAGLCRDAQVSQSGQ